jgi:hypothetical protein
MCQGFDPESEAGRIAGRSARHLYDFVYKDRLLDGSETAQRLGMEDRDVIYTLPIHFWTREPERLLYGTSSTERRAMVTLFTACRAPPAGWIPNCASSISSAFEERLQLHLDEPHSVARAVHSEYLDVARASNRFLSTKQRHRQAIVDLSLACSASDFLAHADVFATFAATARPRDVRVHDDSLLHEGKSHSRTGDLASCLL